MFSLPIILWLMTWGGMFTGLYNINGSMFSSPLALFQGARALLPIAALYICVIYFLISRIKLPPLSAPLGFLTYYCFAGLLISLFSPAMSVSMYWGGVFLAPLLVVWIVHFKDDPLTYLKKFALINYIIAIFFTISLFPQAVSYGQSGDYLRFGFYVLPFRLGEIRANGVGRFALIVLIVAAVRLIFGKSIKRYFWLAALFPGAYLLFRSQSRTALLGLVVASGFFVYILGIRWQFLLVGPGAAYTAWVSGYKWRAHGSLENLVNLTGRELTWQQAIDQVMRSPFLGWGFHTDRLLLGSQHIHNSYLHTLMHAGIVGLLFFVGALISVWRLLLKDRFLKKINDVPENDRIYLIDSVLIISFLTVRSFFESTAAFYGVDLLFFVIAISFIYIFSLKNKQEDKA